MEGFLQGFSLNKTNLLLLPAIYFSQINRFLVCGCTQLGNTGYTQGNKPV